ncbi:MAG: hypothetical protein ACK4Y4_07235 [Brevundimonas sp.]
MRRREGYLAVDALVALAVTALTVTAAVALAAEAAGRVAQARDRLAAARVAEDIYEGLYEGARSDGEHGGETGGREWRYETSPAGDEAEPSSARQAVIVVERRFGGDLTLEAYLPPTPERAEADAAATPSPSS